MPGRFGLRSAHADLLVDDAFPRDFHARIDEATDRVWLQFMTFEADTVGLAVAKRLLDAKARGVDVRVVVDAYTDWRVSDLPVHDPRVREEAKETERMWLAFRAADIPVVRTRPLGPLNVLWLFRDHKKIAIVDDAVYLGGINLSEHNYAWHDFMVRFDDAAAVEACAKVLEATLRGEAPDLRFECGVVTNRHVEKTFDALLAEAKEEVVVSAPYLADWDLVQRLTRIPKTVRRVVLASADSNLRLFRVVNLEVFERLERAGVEVWVDEGFSHARFLLVDGETAFVSSSNFGRESLRCKDEIGIVVRDRSFVARMRADLVEARLQGTRRFDRRIGLWQHVVGRGALHGMRAALRVVPLMGRWSDVLDR